MTRNRLRKLQIDRVDLVPAGANPGAWVEVFKQEEERPATNPVRSSPVGKKTKELTDEEFEAAWLEENSDILVDVEDDKGKAPSRTREPVVDTDEPETTQERQQRLYQEAADQQRRERVNEQARVEKQAESREAEKERCRQEMVDRQVLFSAAELARQGWDPRDALRKAVEQQAGLNSTISGTIEAIAKRLVEAGYSKDDARKTAAEAVLIRKRQELEARAEGERQEIAAELRLARLAKGLTQAELANLAGVSERSVINHEGGQALPSGLVAYRLVQALELDSNMVYRIDKAR